MNPDQIRQDFNDATRYHGVVRDSEIEKAANNIADHGGEGCDRIFVHTNKKAITHALKSIGKWDAITDHNLEILCESVEETM